jgi:hypothetical protein
MRIVSDTVTESRKRTAENIPSREWRDAQVGQVRPSGTVTVSQNGHSWDVLRGTARRQESQRYVPLLPHPTQTRGKRRSATKSRILPKKRSFGFMEDAD